RGSAGGTADFPRTRDAMAARGEVRGTPGDRGGDTGDDEHGDPLPGPATASSLTTALAKAVVGIDAVVEEHPRPKRYALRPPAGNLAGRPAKARFQRARNERAGRQPGAGKRIVEAGGSHVVRRIRAEERGEILDLSAPGPELELTAAVD